MNSRDNDQTKDRENFESAHELNRTLRVLYRSPAGERRILLKLDEQTQEGSEEYLRGYEINRGGFLDMAREIKIPRKLVISVEDI